MSTCMIFNVYIHQKSDNTSSEEVFFLHQLEIGEVVNHHFLPCFHFFVEFLILREKYTIDSLKRKLKLA